MKLPITFQRWNRNPFQMWMLLLLIYISSNQVFLAKVGGAVADLARQAQLNLAICNLTGGFIVFCGLHVRERNLAKWIELCGYIALIGSMGIYVWIVLRVSDAPSTSFGVGLSEAFVLASFHRSLIVAWDKIKLALQLHRRRKGDDDDADEDPALPG